MLSTDLDMDYRVCDFGEIYWENDYDLNSDISRSIILNGKVINSSSSNNSNLNIKVFNPDD